MGNLPAYPFKNPEMSNIEPQNIEFRSSADFLRDDSYGFPSFDIRRSIFDIRHFLIHPRPIASIPRLCFFRPSTFGVRYSTFDIF